MQIQLNCIANDETRHNIAKDVRALKLGGGYLEHIRLSQASSAKNEHHSSSISYINYLPAQQN